MIRWKKIEKSGATIKNKIWNRGLHISKDYVGKTVDVHCGNGFVTLFITEEMVGCLFGEFVTTRKFTQKWEKNWRITASVIRKKKK